MFNPFATTPTETNKPPTNAGNNNLNRLFGNRNGNALLHEKRNRNGNAGNTGNGNRLRNAGNNGNGNRLRNAGNNGNRNGNGLRNAGNMNMGNAAVPNSGSPVTQSGSEEILPVPMGMGMAEGEVGEMTNENTTIYGDKHHFYIGSMIHRDYTGDLARIQKEVKSSEFQNPRWNIFHLRHIYLGYLDTRVAKEMMKKIFLPLCLAIGQTVGPIECDYTKLMYRSKPPKNTGPKIISLGFKDKMSLLEKKIIPYLKREGLRKIYNVETKPERPAVDLLYLNAPDDIYRQVAAMMSKRIRIPTRGFEINHLCLLKETPYSRRGGIPSRYDRMNVESVKGYYYPLKGNKEEFNREYSRINQMRIEDETDNQAENPV